ncbi:hypothetical protein OS493_033612 [Desmophyllum pertusum]|uniref:Uncharacterized protein n=1 Tax=Desmophyllum pertusum TaxID=174260 RepID=A0A9W9YVS7_9CNID|nr:hypothetical protein OS493_033612 [Desmophyllum pertusum]
MPDLWSCAVYGTTFTLTVGATVGAKFACNACLPGSGAAVEFVLAGKCLYDGCNERKRKDRYYRNLQSKRRSRPVRKQPSNWQRGDKRCKRRCDRRCKDGTKQVGQKYGKELGKGVITQAVEKAYYQGTKMTFQSLGQTGFLAGVSSGGKQVGEIISKEVLGEILTKTAERTLYETAKESQKFALTEAAKKGAEEMFKKQAYKLLVKDVACAGAKAAIRCDSSDREQGLTHWLDWIVSPTVKFWALKEPPKQVLN